MISKIWHVCILAVATQGCLKGPTFMKQSGSANFSSGGAGTTKAISSVVDQDGAEVGTIRAGANFTQEISASSSSAVAGTVASFPPGSLAISTDIAIEEGASVATLNFAADLGLTNGLLGTGPSVAIQPTIPTDPVQPFSLSIGIPSSSGLNLTADDLSKLVVFYKVKIVAENRFVAGVIPRSDLVIEGQSVRFSARYFGAFQSAFTVDLVADAKEVASTTVVQTKKEIENLPSIAIIGRTPFLVGAGEKVELTGSNFRSTMMLAMGGAKVTELKVLSDSRATFVAPAGGTGFGLTTLTAEQDGASQSVSLFYKGTKTDLPISTMAESDVCKGQKFYDASGNVKSGNKNCDAVACTADGQQNCVASGSFKAINPSVIDGSKMLPSQSILGVSGTLDLSGLVPANIKASTVIGGVTGTFGSVCSSNGQQNCVVSGAFKSGSACAAGGSGCFLEPYVASSQPLKAIDFDSIDSSKMLTTLSVGGVTGTVNLVALSPSNIKDQVTIAGVTGTYGTACTADGQQGCIATGSFKALNPTSLDTSKILSNLSILGVNGGIGNCTDAASGCYVPAYVAGSFPLKAIDYDAIVSNASQIRAAATIGGVSGTLADCSSNGTSGCVATATFNANNVSNLTPGVVKRGVTIAGITGQFPSSTYPLPRYSDGSTSATASDGVGTGLTLFATQLISDAAFEFWDAAGQRRTGSGDSDIVATNVKSNVLFENVSVTGSYGGVTLPQTWDVRAGVDRGDGQVGQLKVNCRNSVTSAAFNYDGLLASITTGAIATGTTKDWWDTIDDFAGLPAGFPPTWSATDTLCGGVESAAGDGNVWKDLTTNGGACGASNCRVVDKISGLQWSKLVATVTWPNALNNCNNLTNDGLTGWRLPTQKELLAAYEHGLISAARTYWITLANISANYFWSATTSSTAGTSAWAIHLDEGLTYEAPKTSAYHTVCVR